MKTQPTTADLTRRLADAEAVVDFYNNDDQWKSAGGGTRRILHVKVNENGYDKARDYRLKYPATSPQGEQCSHPMAARKGLSPVDRSEKCLLCGLIMTDPMLEMDAGAGQSDYPMALIFTSSKFIVTAFGYDREHCEDVLQCVLHGRFGDHEGDREWRKI